MLEDLIRAVLGMPPGLTRINKDLAIMRERTRPILQDLIPWEEEEELELLSMKMEIKTHKRGMDRMLIGTFHSIYMEPMITFAYMDYMKGAREGLLYCRSRSFEFVYRIKRKDVDVFFNGQQVAIIDQTGIMHGLRSRSALGSVKPYSADLLSVIVLDREAGHLFNPMRPHTDIQRAFYMMSKMEDETLRIFLSLGLYELITRMLANKKKK